MRRMRSEIRRKGGRANGGQGRQRQYPRGAQGNQKAILAHRVESLPGPRFVALQQNDARGHDPDMARW